MADILALSFFYAEIKLLLNGLITPRIVNLFKYKLLHNGQQAKAMEVGSKIKELPCRRVPTTSLVDESCVYGRDDDKEALVKLLIPVSDNANQKVLDVIPIVGMAGVGKTSLAQLVYNDSRVDKWFGVRAWVCVSKETDVFKITKYVVEEIGSEICEIKSCNQLQLQVRKRLNGKKFLPVLDDFCNSEYLDWDIFQTPFKHREKGSKIIVTTRHKSVASILHTVPPYHVKELSDGCYSQIMHLEMKTPAPIPTWKTIGKEIARKCIGVPFAAKFLGRGLRWERDFEAWKKMSKTSLLDHILPAIEHS